jgi:hypothetical protein
MAAVPRVETENRMERVLSEPPPMVLRTDVHGGAKQTSFIEPELVGQTRAVFKGSPTSIISEVTTSKHADTMPLMATAGIRKIDGVVSEIMKDTVVIQCMFTTGNFDLRLPPALVPVELRSFGTPVWISLETTGGVRMPVVEPRPIERQPKIDGQNSVEDWLNSA